MVRHRKENVRPEVLEHPERITDPELKWLAMDHISRCLILASPELIDQKQGTDEAEYSEYDFVKVETRHGGFWVKVIFMGGDMILGEVDSDIPETEGVKKGSLIYFNKRKVLEVWIHEGHRVKESTVSASCASASGSAE